MKKPGTNREVLREIFLLIMINRKWWLLPFFLLLAFLSLFIGMTGIDDDPPGNLRVVLDRTIHSHGTKDSLYQDISSFRNGRSPASGRSAIGGILFAEERCGRAVGQDH